MIFEEAFEQNHKQISYIRYGEWTEKVILFFHGFTGSKRFIPENESNSGICILSFDRPGVGKSDMNEYYKMENFLNHINSVLENKNIESVHLIGHSAGGYYAQLFAELYPQKVKSLSLLSSMIPLNSPNTKGILNMQWKIIKFITLYAKNFSKFYFRKMAEAIIKNYDKQFEKNLIISLKKKDVLCVRISILLKMQSSIPLLIMDWVCIMTHMHYLKNENVCNSKIPFLFLYGTELMIIQHL